MLFVPRSVPTSVLPSGLKETCAPSASSALSASFAPASGSSLSPAIVNPSMLAEPLFRT